MSNLVLLTGIFSARRYPLRRMFLSPGHEIECCVIGQRLYLHNYSILKIVCSFTSAARAARAVSIILRCSAFSSCSGRSGLPTGYGIETPGTTRLAPTEMEMDVTVQICTTGIPAASMCFAIVAPQRVQVPQVEVRITPSISASRSCFAIDWPNAAARSVPIPFPTVTKVQP